MHPFWIALIIFCILLLCESVTSWLFIRRARRQFPLLWEHAGRPTILTDGDLISAWHTNRYLLQRSYRVLDDPAARQFADRARLPVLVAYLGCWLGVIGFFASLAIFGRP